MIITYFIFTVTLAKRGGPLPGGGTNLMTCQNKNLSISINRIESEIHSAIEDLECSYLEIYI